MLSEACVCVRSLSDPMSKKWKCSRNRHSSGCAQAIFPPWLREWESESERTALLLKKRKTSSLTLHSRGGGKRKQPLTSMRASDIHHVVYSCRSLTWHLVSLRRDGGGGGGLLREIYLFMFLSVSCACKVLNSENWIRQLEWGGRMSKARYHLALRASRRCISRTLSLLANISKLSQMQIWSFCAHSHR